MKTILATLLLSACIVRAADFYVSPNGNDAGDGSKDHPFATLERARTAARDAKAASGSAIWLEPGLHRRTETFQLDARDSGLTVRSVGGGVARLHAGRRLKAEEFHPVTDAAVLSRLDPLARGKVVQLDLAALKIEHAAPFPTAFHDGGGLFDLYFGDESMPLSRWPNAGSTTMEKVLDRGDFKSKAPDAKGGVFVAREDRVARWRVEGGVWLQGYWRVPWEPWTIRVKSIDPATRTIAFAAPIPGGIGSKYAKGGQLGDGKENWCALNLLEEIDRPGEWCVNFATKTLYFWPPEGWPHGEISISDCDKPMVTVKDASHVTLRGLQFEGGLGNGVEIASGTDNLIAGCTLRNLGGKGVCIEGGSNNGVRSCDFYTLGQGGIYLAGGDRATLKPCGNFAENNDLHHLGLRQKTYAVAIHVGAFGGGEAVGCRVAHNYIHDLPHAGVLYGGNDNLFEYNEVARIALTSGDVGAFYTWNDWTSWGNILRYNFVHDCPRANAFYMDDGDSGDSVFGNVAYRVSYGSMIGGGHFNGVRNNLIIEAERGLHLDARGIARGYAKNPKMLKRLESVNAGAPPWSERYPSLAKLLTGPRDLPTGNVLENNVLVRCKKPLLLAAAANELRLSTVRDNLDLGDTDPGFVDAARLNFALKPGSPVFKKLPAFEPIPFAKIGLMRDEFRQHLPERSAAAPANNAGGVFDSNTDVQRSNQSHP